MPLFLLLAIRLFASSYIPSDALICRSIMAFTFFGACVGGLATSLLTFCFHCRDVWALSSPEMLRRGYWIYTAIGLPVLTLATAAGLVYTAAYLHWWIGEGRVVYGVWGSQGLAAWGMVDSLIEFRFLWWFHGYEGRYWGKVVRVSEVSQVSETSEGVSEEGGHKGGAGNEVRELEIMRDGIWWVPRWRFWVLKAALGAWVVVMLTLFWR